MKILIIYYSETGNTEIIAKAIHEVVVQDHDAYLKKIDEVTVNELNNYDLVFLGSPCHSANLAPPVLKLIENFPMNPNFKLAGFFTHSTFPPEGSERNASLYEKWAGKCSKTFEKLKTEKGVDFRGYFRCQGAPSPLIEKFIHKQILPDEDEWREYIEEVRKHPDTTDIENAKKFARKILEQFP